MLLAGFEPEEESPIVFLRLRRDVRTRNAAGLRPRAVRHPRRGEAAGHGARPRCPARRRSRCARWPTARWGGPAIEALAAARRRRSSPASGWPRCPAPSPRWSRWPGATGARVGLGAAPGRGARCGRGRRAARPAARRPQRRRRRRPRRRRPALGAGPRRRPGHARAATSPASSPPPATAQLGGLLVGGVDPADLPDPALAEAALAGAGFVVSLEMFPTAVTEWADVVLPVAAAPEKAGSYLDWEGRVRVRSTPPCTAPGSCPTAGCCRAWPTRWTSTCGCPPPRRPAPSSPRWAPPAVRAEGIGLDVRAAGRRPTCGRREAVLASWRQLIDAGTLQRDEPELAGTARPPVARIGAGRRPAARAWPTATG